MRQAPVEVREVLDIAEKVYDNHNRLFPKDVISSAKLCVEVRDEVRRVYIDDQMRKRFYRGIIEWGIFQKGLTYKRLYDKVFDYLSIFELDEHKERYVKEYIVAYSEYAAKRWGKQTYIGTNSDVVEAAKVAKRLVKAYSITMYEYMRRQHECWDKIKQPLSIVAMMDEGRCRKRHEVFTDVNKKRGIVRKEDYKEGLISRKWKEILAFGVQKFLDKSAKRGYLSYVAKLYVDDVSDGLSASKLEKKYSPENVEEAWVEAEKEGMEL